MYKPTIKKEVIGILALLDLPPKIHICRFLYLVVCIYNRHKHVYTSTNIRLREFVPVGLWIQIQVLVGVEAHKIC